MLFHRPQSRDWPLIIESGGSTESEGYKMVGRQVLPLKKGWAEMVLSMLNRGGGGGAQNGIFNI